MRLSARASSGLLLFIFLMCSFVGCSSTTGGSTTITDRFNIATVSPGQIVPITAKCNPGEQMLSGGWAVTTPAYSGPVSEGRPGPNDDQQYYVAGSYPSDSSSWTAIFTNEATGDSQGDVSGVVHVECLSTGTTPTLVTQVGTDPESSIDTTPSCPHGSSLTGGGYELLNFMKIPQQMVDFTESNSPFGLGTPPTQWSVSTNFTFAQIGQVGASVEAFAVCSSNLTTSFGSSAMVKAPYSSSTVPTLGTTLVSCGNSEVPVGSGYRNGDNVSSFPLTTFYPDYGGAPPQWDVRAYALPDIPIDSPPNVPGGSAVITPICAKLP